jgi:hypothetical protein
MAADPDNQGWYERVAACGCPICRIAAIRHGKRCGEFPG